MTLYEAQFQAERLLDKLSKVSPEDAEICEASLEHFYNDQVSVEELISHMQLTIIEENRWR
jgi:hypothetical protein